MSGAGAWALGSRPTFGGNLAWDAGNFNPANYLPLAGGTMTGGLTLQRTSVDYNAVVLNNVSGVQLQIDANANTEGNIRTTTNHPLTFMTNNTLRMTIAAGGDISMSGALTIGGGRKVSKVTLANTAPGTLQDGELYLQY